MQKSIEVEYWVIDRDGSLAAPGPLADVSEHVEEEFVEPLLELKTPPRETSAALRSTFVEQLDALLSAAADHDRLLVPLGTPINAESISRWPSERGRIQERVIGANFDYAKYCAGTHLHFEQRNVTDQLNVLIALDPAFALVNSSPYFQGASVANTARAYLYRKKGYEEFPKHGQLWDYVDTVAQWERRLDRRFEEFRDAALAAGVDAEAVDANFSPAEVVWTPVRLREAMPTVEWRSPDAALPSQVLRLAEQVDDLMERLHHTNVRVDGTIGGVQQDAITLPEFDTVCDHVEAAMHEGIASPDVAAYLARLGFDVDGYDPIAPRIDGRAHVSPEDARALRLQYGRLLERDVRSLRQTPAVATDAGQT